MSMDTFFVVGKATLAGIAGAAALTVGVEALEEALRSLDNPFSSVGVGAVFLVLIYGAVASALKLEKNS